MINYQTSLIIRLHSSSDFIHYQTSFIISLHSISDQHLVPALRSLAAADGAGEPRKGAHLEADDPQHGRRSSQERRLPLLAWDLVRVSNRLGLPSLDGVSSEDANVFGGRGLTVVKRCRLDFALVEINKMI